VIDPRNPIDVALGVLLEEARLWRNQQARLADCRLHAENLVVSEAYENAVLNGFITVYNTAATTYAQRCGEGSAAAFRVAEALRAVHDTYAAEEERNLHALRRLH